MGNQGYTFRSSSSDFYRYINVLCVLLPWNVLFLIWKTRTLLCFWQLWTLLSFWQLRRMTRPVCSERDFKASRLTVSKAEPIPPSAFFLLLWPYRRANKSFFFPQLSRQLLWQPASLFSFRRERSQNVGCREDIGNRRFSYNPSLPPSLLRSASMEMVSQKGLSCQHKGYFVTKRLCGNALKKKYGIEIVLNCIRSMFWTSHEGN